jgi:hypothetical protein
MHGRLVLHYSLQPQDGCCYQLYVLLHPRAVLVVLLSSSI